jgi:hypothetical protein
LAAVLAAAVALGRERARDLLIEGGDVGLPVVARERRRLLAARRQAALADALEDLVGCVECSDRLLAKTRPVYSPLLVRQVAPELSSIAADLRSGAVGIRGVARIERLLTVGTSPFFGSEAEELRGELGRIRAETADRALPAEKPLSGHASVNVQR